MNWMTDPVNWTKYSRSSLRSSAPRRSFPHRWMKSRNSSGALSSRASLAVTVLHHIGYQVELTEVSKEAFRLDVPSEALSKPVYDGVEVRTTHFLRGHRRVNCSE